MPDASSQLQSLFNSAMAALSQGKTSLALSVAQQAITIAPKNPDVFNLLGVCAIRLLDRSTAEQCWLHAIQLHTESIEARFNLGLLYADTGQHALASRYLTETIIISPQYTLAYGHLALLHANRNEKIATERDYRRTLQLDPGDVASWNNLGVLLAAQHRYADAESCYRHGLAFAPDDDKTYGNLGILLVKIRRFPEAERCYSHAIDINPNSAQAHANLGLLFSAIKQTEAARSCLQLALRLYPDSAEILGNLADLQSELLEDNAAEHNYRAALIMKPDSAVVLSNYGVFLAYRLRDGEAETNFRRSLAVDADYPTAKLNFSMLLLTLGRLREGWPYHEARYDARLPMPDMPKPTLTFPQWQGESLKGKSLIVWPEQGHGDLIQMCRYVPLVKASGAAHITLVCRPNQVELMRTLQGADEVIGSTDIDLHSLDYDYWVFPMSFPLLFDTGLDNIPLTIPYLHVNDERATYWAQRLPKNDGRLRVGIVWRGNPSHANDNYRSLPDPALLSPLWGIAGAQYFSLQMHNGPFVAHELVQTPQLVELGSQIRDFADSAAILQHLDLLISVDTAAAHLAGALGKQCWVLLPHHRTDWRWMRERADSPWYRGMRLFRQKPQKEWSDVIDDVAAALRGHAASK
jgi:Tfp pilus assembly protein PilF